MDAVAFAVPRRFPDRHDQTAIIESAENSISQPAVVLRSGATKAWPELVKGDPQLLFRNRPLHRNFRKVDHPTWTSLCADRSQIGEVTFAAWKKQRLQTLE